MRRVSRMGHPRQLEAGEPASGLATKLRFAAARGLRWVGRRPVRGTAAREEAQFTAHVEQALQIFREDSGPRVVALPDDRPRLEIRR